MRIRFHRMAFRGWCALLIAVACLSSGCAQWSLKKSLSKPFFSESKDDPQVPGRVVAIWVDTIRYTQGQTPTRGFGGRLMFYEEGEEVPVKVDGDLVVYAFDEDGRKQSDPRPTRKYVFPADQLEAHYSKSKVGHSYSFFVPWDELGGVRKEISLIVRFQPKVGAAVASEQTHHILPGKPVPEETQLSGSPTEDRSAGGVRAASFNSSAAAARSRMQTATISLPSKFGQQTPTAEVRSRFTRSRSRASAQAGQELPENPTQATPPSTDSRLSRSHLRAVPAARREGDRAVSPPRLAEWQSPGRPTLPAASGSESN